MRITTGAVGTVTIVGGIDTNAIPGNTYTSYGPVTVANTATLVQASAAGNKSVILKAASSNSEAIYIGDSGLTDPGVTEDGTPLSAGEALVLDTSAAVYAISDNGGQKVYLSVISKV